MEPIRNFLRHKKAQVKYYEAEATKIDYEKKAKDWMKPLVAGQQTGLVEIPANWYLDVCMIGSTM